MPLVMNNDFAADGLTVGGTWTRQTPLVFQLGEQNAHISANGTYKIIQKPSAGQCPEEKSTCVQLSPPATVCPATGHYIHIVPPARPLSLLPLRMLSHYSFSLPWRCRCAPTATVLVGKGAGHLCFFYHDAILPDLPLVSQTLVFCTRRNLPANVVCWGRYLKTMDGPYLFNLDEDPTET